MTDTLIAPPEVTVKAPQADAALAQEAARREHSEKMAHLEVAAQRADEAINKAVDLVFGTDENGQQIRYDIREFKANGGIYQVERGHDSRFGANTIHLSFTPDGKDNESMKLSVLEGLGGQAAAFNLIVPTNEPNGHGDDLITFSPYMTAPDLRSLSRCERFAARIFDSVMPDSQAPVQ